MNSNVSLFELGLTTSILEKVLDSHAIVGITDESGKIVYANDKFSEISKYPLDEIIGKDHIILNSGVHPKGFFKKMYETITDGNVWHENICNRAKDGSLYWVSTTINPVISNNGQKFYVAIRTDITEEVQLTEKLTDTLDKLEIESKLKEERLNQIQDLNKRKDHFSSMVTHELKTPLTPIIGWSQSLLDEKILGSLTEPQKNAVNKILSNTERLKKLIGDVLDIQKLEIDQMKFDSSTFDVTKMIHDTVESNKPVFDKKRIEIISDVDEGLVMKSDENRILQVLYNLIINTIDFVDEGTGKVIVSAHKNQEGIEFGVEDNGIGISAENIKNLFQKFHQLDTSASRPHQGSGLGLSICKGIIEKLDGKIWADSIEGKGSNFKFQLPLEVQK